MGDPGSVLEGLWGNRALFLRVAVGIITFIIVFLCSAQESAAWACPRAHYVPRKDPLQAVKRMFSNLLSVTPSGT
ncbi:hypothetical protein EYF80_031750 [Liparis tanakae]|uniref:Uncharacterized protein n=1 Tax=Liparis tanakae TaxID=230148 RepID=A0A4Z2GZC1_9TELE|nr:hypothetical protein EYF80_031750 [Liparis tanakae]